jgi:CelD/BcsL family acetyltransferase involved in cellulose biosynthesis
MSIQDLPENIFKISVIEDPSHLNTIYSKWLSLYNQDISCTPFQSPDWIISWCRYFVKGSIHLIKISTDDNLVCIAPCYIYYGGGRRELKFLGSGNTDYMYLLIKKGYEEKISSLFYDYIFSVKNKFDEVFLQNIPPAEMNVKLKKFYIETEPYPVLYLPKDFNTYLSKISRNFINNIKRNLRQLEETGELTFQTAEENELDEYLDQLFDLHGKSWNERDAPGVFGDKETRNFHKTAVENLHRNNSVKLFRLTLDRKPIALLYMLVKDKTYYYYISGFSPEYKKYSPGSVILYKIIEEAFRLGIRKIDFLKGSEAYKYRWGAVDTHVYTLFLNRQELISL